MLTFILYVLAGLGIAGLLVIYQANKDSFTPEEMKGNKVQWLLILMSAVIYHLLHFTGHRETYLKLFPQPVFWVAQVGVLWYFMLDQIAEKRFLKILKRSVLTTSLVLLVTTVWYAVVKTKPTAEDYKQALLSRGIILFAPTEEGLSDTVVTLTTQDTMVQIKVFRSGYGYSLNGDPTTFQKAEFLKGGLSTTNLTRMLGVETSAIRVTVGPYDDLPHVLQAREEEKTRKLALEQAAVRDREANRIREMIVRDSLWKVRDDLYKLERDSLRQVSELKRDSSRRASDLRSAERRRLSDSLSRSRRRYSDSVNTVDREQRRRSSRRR